MNLSQEQKIRIFAPAKINLYLHITGKLDNGYHELDSLLCFTDIGDHITIQPAQKFSFHVDGPFAHSFTTQERHGDLNAQNLVVQAISKLCQIIDREPGIRVTLHKTLPLASGLGGGSSDAAAVLWGLLDLWDLPPQASYLHPLMLELGSDVPACFSCKPVQVSGIGDDMMDAPDMPELFILLVNCRKSCATQTVYQNFQGVPKTPLTLPENFDSTADFIDFLNTTSNDLTEPALKTVPQIAFVLDLLQAQEGALLSRMSGSGATCFGLFRSEEECFHAAETIIRQEPQWWVRTGTINRPVRY